MTKKKILDIYFICCFRNAEIINFTGRMHAWLPKIFYSLLTKISCILLMLLCADASAKKASTNSDSLLSISITGAWSEDSSSCTIPFYKAGNLIIVQARADTMPGNFILDSGAPHLVLNITYFRNYPLTQVHDAEQSSITGTGGNVQKTTVKQFSFGSLNYYKTEADLVNLGHIENSKGIRILGLLGMELFRNCEMFIDYEKSLLYLHRIGKKEVASYSHAMLKDTAAFTTTSIEIIDNRIVATSFMGGKKLKLMIDSGAESNLLDSRLPQKVFDQVMITGRIVLSGTGTNKVEALSGDIRLIKIGNREIRGMPVVIANLEKTCISYNGCIDGMLGFDFLSLHKIGFNFVTRKMYIWK